MIDKEAIEIMKDWIRYEKANKDKINRANELIKIQETVLRVIDKKDNEIKELRRTSSAKEDFYKTYMEENKKLKEELEKYKKMYAVSIADRVNGAFKQEDKNKEDLEMLYKGCQIELTEKDKIIDEMAGYMATHKCWIYDFEQAFSKDIREHFEKKVEDK